MIFTECEEVTKYLQGVSVTADAIIKAISMLQITLQRLQSEETVAGIMDKVEGQSEELQLVVSSGLSVCHACQDLP